MPLQTNLSYFIILFSLISLSSSSQLTIGIIGDQTASNDLQKPYEILAEGVNILNKLSPNIIIHTGDLIESSLPPDQVSSLFNRAVSILNNLKMPWFLTPGDHDVNPPVFLPDSKDFSRKTLYHNLYIKYNKFLGKDDFYSFNVNGYHIIILDSLSHLHTDPRWGNVFLSQLGENQLRWLAKDLEEAKNAEGIVVFLHQPLWYIK